jgi:host factor-I protein
MDVDGSNLQNDFFNHARKERFLVAVFLANGKKLVGRIKAFDRYTLLLEGLYGEQIVYKHAITTVSPARPHSGTHSEEHGAADDPHPAEHEAESNRP